MLNAIALVPMAIIESDIKTLFDEECKRADINLAYHCVTDSCADYHALFNQHRNVITWNCRMPHSITTRGQKNVLYVENSLLSQSSGIFVDRGGFYSNSNLCRDKAWDRPCDADLETFTKEKFGWQAMAGGATDGPIVVCLQNTFDCNVQHQFPAGMAYVDKIEATLDLVFANLVTDKKVIVRPHPRFIEYWKQNQHKYHLKPNWVVAWEEPFRMLLPRCSALVTVNSTCASEAVTLGLPVATLGIGAFTGSGATLECGNNPRLLQQFGNWRPDVRKMTGYAKAILAHNFIAYRNPTRGNSQLETWLRGAL